MTDIIWIMGSAKARSGNENSRETYRISFIHGRQWVGKWIDLREFSKFPIVPDSPKFLGSRSHSSRPKNIKWPPKKTHAILESFRVAKFWKPWNFCLRNPESGKSLLQKIWILGHSAHQGIRDPTNDRNPESISFSDKESVIQCWLEIGIKDCLGFKLMDTM